MLGLANAGPAHNVAVRNLPNGSIINYRQSRYQQEINVKYIRTFGLTIVLFLNMTVNAAESTTIQDFKRCGADYGKFISQSTVQFPPIGFEAEGEVGQSLIATYNIDLMGEKFSYSFKEKVLFSGTYAGQEFNVEIYPQELPISIESGNYKLPPKSFSFQYKNDSSPRSGISKPDLLISFDLNNDTAVATLAFGFIKRQYPIDSKVKRIDTEKCTRAGVNSFRRELVYSGTSQGTISLLYREYFKDMARPEFSQELHYDLKDGDEIGFRGARFKVIKASNVGIKYRVTKYLN